MVGAMPATVVFLHGFAGTGRAWDAVVERLDGESYRALTPDLRGHGASAGLRPITFADCVADVLAAAPDQFDLCGYSMGGRLALQVALAAPERVQRLILVSATAGIDDDSARADRRASDEALADEIERGSIEQFAERWLSQPLFAQDEPQVGARAREDMLRNDPAALAAVLRGIGTGQMEPLWERLGGLGRVDVAVIGGERDAKFAAIGARLAQAIPRASLRIVSGAGHAIPRQAPGALAAMLTPRL